MGESKEGDFKSERGTKQKMTALARDHLAVVNIHLRKAYHNRPQNDKGGMSGAND